MNRRDFLKVMGIGTGAALVGADVAQALAAPDLPQALRSATAIDQQDPVAHILNRVTFGPRPGQVDMVKKVGLQAYLDQQLSPQSINDDASEERLGNYITLDMTPVELYALGTNQRQTIIALDSATVMRATYSERQLFEVMVAFWSEHFSIWQLKESDKFLKTMDDREVVRTHAFGKFRDILGASAKSPAMLIYLDNAESIKTHPNENYAREIMELHTLSVGNYSETDVSEVARCFTGWTIQGQNTANVGEFIFNAKFHDDGAKTVLGHSIPAGGGIQDGETVLDILASHPSTAQFIATKLARRFIADDPPDTVVKALTQTFLGSGGDIPSMLRVILAAPEFMSAPPKFKRPFEYLISLFRAFDVQLDPVDIESDKPKGLASLALLTSMGQLPFNHITPEGYTDHAAEWISNMLVRWNTAIQVVTGALPAAHIDLTAVAKSQNVDIKPRPVLDFFAQHLLGRALSQAELDAIWGFASKGGEPDLTTDAGRQQMRSAIALIAASPAFQYR
jgi:Protein of unknown function (DUF1800)